MNNIKHIRKRSIGTFVLLLILLCFIFTPALLFGNFDFGSGFEKTTDEEEEKLLNLSTNYLFKGTTYTFNLDDFYDDTYLYKIYTGAKFQTEAFNGTSLEWSGVVNNDTVTPVDNDEIQYGESSGVYNGTYDFREYDDGTSGYDIDFIDNIQAGGTAEIVALYGDHKKVLKLGTDIPTGIWHYILHPPVSGIVELFWKGVTGNPYMRVRDEAGNQLIDIRFYDDGDVQVRYGNGAGGSQWTTDYVTITEFPHFRIQFDCLTDKMSVWIEGTGILDEVNFINDRDAAYVDRLRWYFNAVTECYIDAVSFKTGDYLATEPFDYDTEEGVYYGTYDFRDELGETDLEIDFVDHIIGTAEIISDYEGHKNVLNFTHDATNSVQNYLPVYQTSGTIEFYLKEVLSRTYFRIQDIGGLLLFEIMSYPTYVKVYYGDGAGGNVYSANYFFTTDFPYFKVSFDCGTDTFSVWCEDFLMVDNVNFKDNEDLTEVYKVRTYNSGASDFYLDAVGYSWDSTSHSGLGYTIGWNINPYDLEPLLENCFDILGVVYNTSIRVNPYVYEHSNVLEFYDNSSVGAPSSQYYYDEIQTDSTIEFWWAYDGTLAWLHYFVMKFYESSSERVRILFGYQQIGQIVYHNGTSYLSIVTDLPTNTFYHIKIVFDDSANTFDFYIDGVNKGTFDYFSNSAVGISKIAMYTRSDGFGYHHWIDALGIVGVNGYEEGDNLEGWDKDYTIGENLYPDNINMIKGSYDYTDNMKVNDDTSTNFTSTHTDGYIHEMPHQWDNFTFTEGTGDTIGDIETIDADYSTLISTEYIAGPDEYITDMDYTYGAYYSGELSNTWVNDSSTYTGYSNAFISNYYRLDVEYLFDDALNGRDFLISARITQSGGSGVTPTLHINDVPWKSGNNMNFVDELAEDVTKISYYIIHPSQKVYMNIYYFKIVEVGAETPALLDVQVDIQVTDPDLSSIEYFKFSHKNNISVTMDLDIWNWDTSTWYEIESIDNSATFDDDSFTLGVDSDYVNSSFGVRIRFQASSSSSDFALLIDRLRLDYLTTPAELEMTITFTFVQYNEDLLFMNVSCWQKMNISQMINFSIWNYDTELYVQISSSADTTFTKKEYNTTSPNNFISPTGVVKLYWISSNSTNNFELYIDYLFIQIFYKLDLVHEKSFDTNGIYRYRWVVLGSIYYTQWVVFEVVDPIPNFCAISESDVTTRWILQGSDISAVEDFHDDITTITWSLIDVSNRTFIYSSEPTHDTFVREGTSSTNYGSSDVLISGDDAWIGGMNWVYLGLIYPYLDINSSESSLYAYGESANDNPCIDVYHTSSFLESTLTWNNKPVAETLQVEDLVVSIGWDTYSLGDPNYYYLVNDSVSERFWVFSSSEESGYEPIITHNFSKNYQGSGYMYMQTDTPELLSLRSEDYGTHYNLSSGDYFEVDFQTNSDSQINIILLKDGVVNKTLTLSPSGNTNFNRHSVQVSVDEDVEFDQLKISSTFEDTDNVKVYDIKTYEYTITGDYKDFYVGSKRTEDVYMTPDTYNLRIFEEGIKKIDTNITISGSDYYYVYTPIQTQYCRIALFSVEGNYLNFQDYHVKVNRSLNGEYNQFWLLDTIFYADDETYAYIDIYDRFDSLINSFERLASDYIDLEIEVYQLQIKNLQTQKTTIDINTTHVYPLLSEESIYFMLSKNYYQIGYYDTNDVYKQFLIYLNSNQAYELNRSKICFLAFINQKGEHLYFNDYKTYINGTLLYENVFYKEIGDKIGIEVKDIYGISIKNQTYTVVSGDNYIPVVLTMYSLKVMSQQLCFNHINITRDPNYYESSYYWSEWIAPSEIIEFKLFAGYYKINLTNNEAESSSYYSYTLSGDDILLIGSNNTIYNVLVNIANVNATIGNQITNVQIDLTNQNSQINNSIINVEINLGNINSTLGNMLVNLDVDITNIANNISTLYVFTNNSFINLNNAMNTSFIYMENNIISINQSISNLVIGVSNDIYLINGTISTMITQLETNLLLMNISIDTALFDLDTTLDLIGSNITSNYILLNNSIYLNSLNINDSRIAIINNLLLVNNTISTLIADVYSAVYLINNSIYTAVVDLGTYLSLINNTISGNLSIVLQMNEFLTEIYKMTMFSDLLNWTNIGLNTSLLTSQIDVWEFINNYRNESIMVFLKYQDLIENITISAQNTIEQFLPNEDVEYRLWSVEDEEYLNEWTPLPDNKTVNFGFFEEEIPIDPTPIATTYFTLFIALIFFVVMSLGVLKLYYSLKERRTPIPPEVLRYMNKKSKKKIDGVVDNRI